MAGQTPAKDGVPTQRWVLYLRVSTDQQSTDLQRRDLVEYAERRGWRFEVYEDTGSGTTSNRKMLQRLLVRCRSREVDGVAVWRMDRLFRSLKHAVMTLQEFTELGVSFYSHKDAIDLSTSTGRLVAHILMSLAEFEASLIKSRVVAGLDAARARGVRLGRPVVVTDSIRAEVIRLRTDEGRSLREIERLLNKRVSRTSIERILRAEVVSKTKPKEEA